MQECGLYRGNLRIVQSEKKKEHESKVRLTNEDIKNGKLTAAKERMGKEDGGLEHSRKKVLNNFESLMPWRLLLDKYFDRDNVNMRTRLV